MTLTIAEAADAIGMKEREVVSVTDSPAGSIVTTFDGNAVIVVDADRPDAAGQTGPLIYAQVDPKASFPIGTFAGEGPDPAELFAGDVDLESLSRDELLDLIAARNAERAANEQLPTKGTKDQLIKVLEATGAAEAPSEDANPAGAHDG